jgi:hypothetical protein
MKYFVEIYTKDDCTWFAVVDDYCQVIQQYNSKIKDKYGKNVADGYFYYAISKAGSSYGYFQEMGRTKTPITRFEITKKDFQNMLKVKRQIANSAVQYDIFNHPYLEYKYHKNMVRNIRFDNLANEQKTDLPPDAIDIIVIGGKTKAPKAVVKYVTMTDFFLSHITIKEELEKTERSGVILGLYVFFFIPMIHLGDLLPKHQGDLQTFIFYILILLVAISCAYLGVLFSRKLNEWQATSKELF